MCFSVGFRRLAALEINPIYVVPTPVTPPLLHRHAYRIDLLRRLFVSLAKIAQTSTEYVAPHILYFERPFRPRVDPSGVRACIKHA